MSSLPTGKSYQPLCYDAWAIPPSSLMVSIGNYYDTCSKCGEPCRTVDLLKDVAKPDAMSEVPDIESELDALLDANNIGRGTIGYGLVMDYVDRQVAATLSRLLEKEVELPMSGENMLLVPSSHLREELDILLNKKGQS